MSYKIVHCNYPEQNPVFPYLEHGKGSFYWCSGKMHNYYVRINAALDIETTKISTDGSVLSVPYVITICLSAPEAPIRFIYKCKCWADVQELLDKISAFYGLGAKKWDKKEKSWVDCPTNCRKLLCFIHNASFEFAFMRTELKFAKDEYSFFCKEKRTVITATLENGIEFRDSMALTNSSLDQLAKMYTKTRKMKGDLDYSIPRNTHTKRTAKEEKYIDNDVLVLAEFCDVYFDKMCQPFKRPPLTNTARLLLKVVEKAEASGIHKDDITKLMPDVETLKRWQKYLFRGGFVHGNIYYINSVVNVLMRDITSSYPGSMFLGYYPVDRFVNAKLSDYAWKYGREPAEFTEHMEKHCVIYEATFYGLRAKTDHSYESLNKVIDWLPTEADLRNGTRGLDNGRIHRCEYVRVMGTELDYEIYKLLYEWDAMELHSFQIATRGELPSYLLECLAADYKRKNDLKTNGLSHTADYTLAKVDVNTYFGMLCKSIFSVNISYDYDLGKWVDREAPEEEIEKDLSKRWLAYQWGIYVCAHSRAKLVRMICAIEAAGGHVIYYDTDSIKYIPSGDGRTEEVFEDENKRIREIRKKYPILKAAAFNGKPGKGLGEWDPEILDSTKKPLLCPFKTLGAKRYLYHQPDGEWSYTGGEWAKEGVGWHLCVAGLPKCAVEHLPVNPFEFFASSGFKFTGEDTGKLRPVYHDEPYDLTITDDEGITETIHANSGVSLVETDFEITEKKLALLILSKLHYTEERKAYG